MALLVQDFHFHNLNNSLIILHGYKLRCLEKNIKESVGCRSSRTRKT